MPLVVAGTLGKKSIQETMSFTCQTPGAATSPHRGQIRPCLRALVGCALSPKSEQLQDEQWMPVSALQTFYRKALRKGLL